MRETNPVKYSVVIPCFNEENYLKRTIKSLQSQDYKGNFEIIVVDNNSTDNTAIIAKRLGVRVISEKNPGVCFARQKGTLSASGSIVISTDADTVFKKNWLSKIDKKFEWRFLKIKQKFKKN